MLIVLRSHNFVSAEQAAAFLGVVPIEKRSGTSVRPAADVENRPPSVESEALHVRPVRKNLQ
nr:IS110 family transposase [Escherichia coli]